MAEWDFRPPEDLPPPAPQPPAMPEVPPSPTAVAAEDEGTEPPPPTQPPFDWLTEVLIPAAVFGLLASFFYYLIDLRGAVGDRGVSGLRWVCFWFLLGTILTTRMRTRYGAHVLALPYMLGLALAMILFVFHVTMYSGSFVGSSDAAGQVVALIFNYALVGLIWWIAGVVTRACTAEENFQVMTEAGLLTSMRRRPKSKKKGDRGGRPRHPGWVLMWTSLVALIIFALGQHVVGGSSAEHRRHAFMCMVSYSFFALLLLALTSLSSLRMSARQRRIRIAGSITPVWTIASALIVIVILVMAAALPRLHVAERVRERIAQLPQGWREPPETPWNDAPGWGSRRPRGDPGGERESDQEQGSAPGAEGDEAGQHTEAGEDDTPTPTGGPEGQQPGSETAAGSGDEGGEAAGQAGTDASGGEGGQGASGQAGEEQSGERHEGSETGTAEQEETPSESGGATDEGRGDQETDTAASGAGTGEQPSRPNQTGETSSSGTIDLLKQLLLWLLILLGLLLLLLLLAYLIYRVLKNRKNLPSFRGWVASLLGLARETVLDAWARVVAALATAWAFLLGLLGWRPRRPKLKEDGLPEDPFTDIFANRELAESLTPAQVVRHVYAAFQAFADLIGHPRDDDQTPYEFGRALPAYIGGMPRHDADDLTGLYVRAAYSPEEVGGDEVDEVRRIWQRMQQPIDEALANRKKPPAERKPSPSPA